MAFPKRALTRFEQALVNTVCHKTEQEYAEATAAVKRELEEALMRCPPEVRDGVRRAAERVVWTALEEFQTACVTLYLLGLRFGVGSSSEHAAVLQENESQEPLTWKRLLAQLADPRTLDLLAHDLIARKFALTDELLRHLESEGGAP